MQLAVADVSAREFLFCVEFFHVSEPKGYDIFKEVMGKAMGFMLKNFEGHTTTTYDAIGLLLCARINNHFRVGQCRLPRVPMPRPRLLSRGCLRQAYVEAHEVRALRTYFDASDQLLWEGFVRILKAHIER